MIRVRWDWLQSPTAVVIGLVLGALLGVYAEGVARVVADFGDLFLAFLGMCAVPVMMGALTTSVCALVRRDHGSEISVVRFAAAMMLGMLAVAAVGAAVAGIGRPGAGIDLGQRRVFGETLVEYVFAGAEEEGARAASRGASGLFRGLVPPNPFVAFVEGNTLQSLFLTLLFSVMLGLLPRSTADPVVQLADAVFNVFQNAIAAALYLLPFGLMGIMAKVVLTTGADLLGATARLIAFTHLACIAVMAVAAVCVASFAGISIRDQLAGLKEALVVAFGTRDSIAAMPVVMSALIEKFGIRADVVKFAAPTGILLCRNSIIILYVVSLIFSAQLYSIPLTPVDMLVVIAGSVVAPLATVGAPALAALGAASMVAGAVGLPYTAVLLIMMGILPVIDPIITMMNVYVISAITILVARRKEAVYAGKSKRAQAAAAGCLLLFAVAPALVGTGPASSLAVSAREAPAPHAPAAAAAPLPPTAAKPDMPPAASAPRATAPAPAAVATAGLAPAPGAGDAARYVRSMPPDIARIVEKGELVVAMLVEEQYPFFYRDGRGEWRGVDIDMASEIARELGVALRIDRVAQTYDAVVDRVDQGLADIAISNLSTTLQRSKSVLFTEPYIPLRQGLVINRVTLAATGRERDDPVRVINDTGARVGVLADSSYVEFAGRRFPGAEIVGYPTTKALFEAVHRGEVMGSLFDEQHIKQYALENPGWLVDVDVKLFEDDKDLIAIAVSWRDPYLHEWLNTYLRVREIRWTIDDLLNAYPPPWKRS